MGESSLLSKRNSGVKTTTIENVQARVLQRKRREQLDKQRLHVRVVPNQPWDWLTTVLPQHFQSAPAAHHLELDEWAWSIEAETRARPFTAFWSRGQGKSTHAEGAVVMVGAKATRKYVLYVRNTQDAADNSVQNISDLLESTNLSLYYPKLGERQVSKYGSSRGWRRNRLRTSSGFTVDALGLDTKMRGAKLGSNRPDLIIFDDIDDKHDTPDATQKKREKITTNILPALAPHGTVLFVQNLIIPDGIAAQLAGVSEINADFLVDRIISGPHPAIRDFEYEDQLTENNLYRAVITKGIPTWEGMNLEACQGLLEMEGLEAFLLERQHEVGRVKDALLTKEVLDRIQILELPVLERIAIGVDVPSSTGQCGIVVNALATIMGVKVIITLEDASSKRGALPHEWSQAVIQATVRWQPHCKTPVTIVVETNQGGKMIVHTLKNAGGQHLVYQEVRASDGKRTRAEPISELAHQNRKRHYANGNLTNLNKLWTTWTPRMPSPDPLDADVWGATFLTPFLNQIAGLGELEKYKTGSRRM
jgi:Terminase RNaseH-like domain